jgi:hypothetical protein
MFATRAADDRGLFASAFIEQNVGMRYAAGRDRLPGVAVSPELALSPLRSDHYREMNMLQARDIVLSRHCSVFDHDIILSH